jgi:aspartate carbamoyltransferase catalytic subunit
MEAVKQLKEIDMKVENPQPGQKVWKHKHILDLDDFSPAEIDLIMQTTDAMHEILSRPIKKVPTLRGKTVVTLFSIRWKLWKRSAPTLW